MTAVPRVLTNRSVLSNLGRLESLIPVTNNKVGQVAKPVKFANSGAAQPFVFEGGVSSGGKIPFYVETSLRK